VALGGGVVSYEQGTPKGPWVGPGEYVLEPESMAGLIGYLAYTKALDPPRVCGYLGS
jgi:hypothetical protein